MSLRGCSLDATQRFTAREASGFKTVQRRIQNTVWITVSARPRGSGFRWNGDDFGLTPFMVMVVSSSGFNLVGPPEAGRVLFHAQPGSLLTSLSYLDAPATMCTGLTLLA